MDQEIYQLLYYYKDEEDGTEGYDLSEVQLLDIDKERAEKLIKLLDNENLFIAYQSMLILIAWGYNEGFSKFDQFILERWDIKEKFSPNRINGEDNVYDEFSYAFLISTYNTISQAQLFPYFVKILDLYGISFFESKLKSVLLKLEILSPLLSDTIEKGMISAIDNKRYYQASQLLPVVSKYNRLLLNKFEKIFKDLEDTDKRIKFNLDEVKQ